MITDAQCHRRLAAMIAPCTPPFSEPTNGPFAAHVLAGMTRDQVIERIKAVGAGASELRSPSWHEYRNDQHPLVAMHCFDIGAEEVDWGTADEWRSLVAAVREGRALSHVGVLRAPTQGWLQGCLLTLEAARCGAAMYPISALEAMYERLEYARHGLPALYAVAGDHHGDQSLLPAIRVTHYVARDGLLTLAPLIPEHAVTGGFVATAARRNPEWLRRMMTDGTVTAEDCWAALAAVSSGDTRYAAFTGAALARAGIEPPADLSRDHSRVYVTLAKAIEQEDPRLALNFTGRGREALSTAAADVAPEVLALLDADAARDGLRVRLGRRRLTMVRPR